MFEPEELMARIVDLEAQLKVSEMAPPAAEQLIACLEGEIAKRDARILELESQYQRDVWGLNNEGDPIGGEPAGGYANDNARLRAELDALKEQEPIGWYTEDHLDDKSATTYSWTVAQRWVEKGWPVSPLYSALVSEAKAQGVVQWPNADEIMQMAFEEGQPADDASGYYFELEEFDLFIERLMSEVARLNAAPAQQVSVPDGFERYRLANKFCEQRLVTDDHVRAIVVDAFASGYGFGIAASPAAPAADAGLVEARKANNELVNDLHVMTNKRRQLVDALTYLRECLDPDDYMGEISMHDFIDDALAAHRAKGVV